MARNGTHGTPAERRQSRRDVDDTRIRHESIDHGSLSRGRRMQTSKHRKSLARGRRIVATTNTTGTRPQKVNGSEKRRTSMGTRRNQPTQARRQQRREDTPKTGAAACYQEGEKQDGRSTDRSNGQGYQETGASKAENQYTLNNGPVQNKK